MPDIYKTIAGDMWDMIAKTQLGGEEYTSLLMEANPEYLDYSVFSAGINLVLPEITTPLEKVLPPWKR